MLRAFAPVLLSICLAVLIGGCDGGGPTEPDGPPDLTDTWNASFEDEIGDDFTMTLQLSTTAVGVSGNGTLEGPEGPTDFTVTSGSYTFPSLQLQLSPDGSRPGTLDGTVSDDGTTIDATLSGTDVGGFSTTPLVLTR